MTFCIIENSWVVEIKRRGGGMGPERGTCRKGETGNFDHYLLVDDSDDDGFTDEWWFSWSKRKEERKKKFFFLRLINIYLSLSKSWQDKKRERKSIDRMERNGQNGWSDNKKQRDKWKKEAERWKSSSSSSWSIKTWGGHKYSFLL